MSSARRPGKRQRRERQTIKLTKSQIARQFSQQRKQRKQVLEKKAAFAAKQTYKPRKKDYGKLILIGTKGQKDPQAKGRKGYLIYVTKTGKKWFVKQATNKRNTSQYKPRKLRSIAPLSNRSLRHKIKDFERSKLVRVATHRAAIKGKGSLSTGGANDFNDKVVTKIAKSLKKTIEGQASHRSFLITAMVLVRLPDGTTETFEIQLPIDKADHISIELGGLENFVRQKFYAFMARELAFKGYVTSGSANHIRRLKDNKGKSRDKWRNKNGELWQGADMETVQIQSIDWKIEQAK